MVVVGQRWRGRAPFGLLHRVLGAGAPLHLARIGQANWATAPSPHTLAAPPPPTRTHTNPCRARPARPSRAMGFLFAMSQKYTGELTSVTHHAAVVAMLALQGCALALVAVGMLLGIPKPGAHRLAAAADGAAGGAADRAWRPPPLPAAAGSAAPPAQSSCMHACMSAHAELARSMPGGMLRPHRRFTRISARPARGRHTGMCVVCAGKCADTPAPAGCTRPPARPPAHMRTHAQGSAIASACPRRSGRRSCCG